jgi:hypothetical protein
MQNGCSTLFGYLAAALLYFAAVVWALMSIGFGGEAIDSTVVMLCTIATAVAAVSLITDLNARNDDR